MPFPRWVAKLNRRLTNRLLGPVVRRSRHHAVVHHEGRVSGAAYRTPVLAFYGPGSGYIALTYGRRADWVQNVLTNGGTVIHRDVERTLDGAAVVGRDLAWPHLPWSIRLFLRILRVREFLAFDDEPITDR